LNGRQLKEIDTFKCVGKIVSINGKVFNTIYERIKVPSQFIHLVKGLLRNKDINNKCKFDILKIYFKRILLYGVETWTIKGEDSKIQAMEIKIFERVK